MAAAGLGTTPFYVRWVEVFLTGDKGRKEVRYYLKRKDGGSDLAVVGKERSFSKHRPYRYTVKDSSLLSISNSSSFLKLRSRKEVVDFLNSIVPVSEMAPHQAGEPSGGTSEAKNACKMNLRVLKDVEVQNMGKHTTEFTWLGSPWTCKKKRRHYQSFNRNGVFVKVHEFVYVLAEENNRLVAYLDDMFEDSRGNRMVVVRWFHKIDEVGIVLPHNYNDREIFFSLCLQNLSIECVDGLATVLSPQHYEKILNVARNTQLEPFVCQWQFDNDELQPFDVTQIKGYWDQDILKYLSFTSSLKRLQPAYDGLKGEKNPAPAYDGLKGDKNPALDGLKGEKNPAPAYDDFKGERNPSPTYDSLMGERNPSPTYDGLMGEKNPSPAYDGLRGEKNPAPACDGLKGEKNPSPAHDGLKGEKSPAPACDGFKGEKNPAPACDGLKGEKNPALACDGLKGEKNPAPACDGLKGEKNPAAAYDGLEGEKNPASSVGSRPKKRLRLTKVGDMYSQSIQSKDDGKDGLKDCNGSLKGCSYVPGQDVLEKHSQCHTIGSQVEVLSQDSGVRGCWFKATIIKKHKNKVKVQYQDIKDPDDETKNLEEWILASKLAAADAFGARISGRSKLRPPPMPSKGKVSWEINVGCIVDAWWHDGWWEGIVVKKESEDELHVYLSGEKLEMTFGRGDLRHSQEWLEDGWIHLKDRPELVSEISASKMKQTVNESCDGEPEKSATHDDKERSVPHKDCSSDRDSIEIARKENLKESTVVRDLSKDTLLAKLRWKSSGKRRRGRSPVDKVHYSFKKSKTTTKDLGNGGSKKFFFPSDPDNCKYVRDFASSVVSPLASLVMSR